MLKSKIYIQNYKQWIYKIFIINKDVWLICIKVVSCELLKIINLVILIINNKVMKNIKKLFIINKSRF